MNPRDEYRTEERSRQSAQRQYDERRSSSGNGRSTADGDRNRRQYDRESDRRSAERNRGNQSDRRTMERNGEGRQPSNRSEYEEKRRRRLQNEKRRKAKRNRLILVLAAACVVVIVIIIIAVSCGKDAKRQQDSAEVPVPDVVTQSGGDETFTVEAGDGETTTATTVDIVNEKPVNLYTMDYNTMTCNKVTELNKAWSVSEDLEAFGAFATSDNSFSFNTETQAHQDTWNSIQTTATYKIGYELSFDVNGEHKVITILKPGDIENNADLYNGDYPESGDYSGITGYMGVWVYDDINQDGGYYIHITQAEFTSETLLTSIKLRPTPQSDQISNLVLKAFSYSSDAEFDANGHYAGKYAASVTINKQ